VVQISFEFVGHPCRDAQEKRQMYKLSLIPSQVIKF